MTCTTEWDVPAWRWRSSVLSRCSRFQKIAVATVDADFTEWRDPGTPMCARLLAAHTEAKWGIWSHPRCFQIIVFTFSKIDIQYGAYYLIYVGYTCIETFLIWPIEGDSGDYGVISGVVTWWWHTDLHSLLIIIGNVQKLACANTSFVMLCIIPLFACSLRLFFLGWRFGFFWSLHVGRWQWCSIGSGTSFSSHVCVNFADGSVNALLDLDRFCPALLATIFPPFKFGKQIKRV